MLRDPASLHPTNVPTPLHFVDDEMGRTSWFGRPSHI